VNIVNRGRIRTSTWLGAVFVAVCVLGAAQVEAHQMPITKICHFKKRKGVFKKISVSRRAARRHLRRHADLFPGGTSADGSITVDKHCKVVAAPTPVLARAYIDADRNGEYALSEDIEIAELRDTNLDGITSIGDTIVLRQFPTSLDPCPLPTGDCTNGIGNYNPASTLLVTDVIESTPPDLIVVIVGTVSYAWLNNTASERFTHGEPFSTITDAFLMDDENFINIQSGGQPDPSSPPAPVNTTATEDEADPVLANDYFLNVEFPQP